jgi:hypothetical protein
LRAWIGIVSKLAGFRDGTFNVIRAVISPEREAGHGRDRDIELGLSVNRRLLNFLSSMLAYIDQSEHLLSKKFGRDSAEFGVKNTNLV